MNLTREEYLKIRKKYIQAIGLLFIIFGVLAVSFICIIFTCLLLNGTIECNHVTIIYK
jgi:hypothetical protein